jgi:hypothetical protein
LTIPFLFPCLAHQPAIKDVVLFYFDCFGPPSSQRQFLYSIARGPFLLAFFSPAIGIIDSYFLQRAA